jgi:hypothetical protein
MGIGAWQSSGLPACYAFCLIHPTLQRILNRPFCARQCLETLNNRGAVGSIDADKHFDIALFVFTRTNFHVTTVFNDLGIALVLPTLSGPLLIRIAVIKHNVLLTSKGSTLGRHCGHTMIRSTRATA